MCERPQETHYMLKFFLLFILSFSPTWSSELSCPVSITSVTELDECLTSNNKSVTRSLKEILDWKRKLKISAPISIEVEKIQELAWANCKDSEGIKTRATKLGLEVEKILQAGSLQIENWKVPNFPATGAKNYSMKKSAGCDVRDLFYQMKTDVDNLVPDLMNVYNLGLAIDTTSSQESNMRALANSIDAIYESIPANANISYVVTSYGDSFRSGLKFEGDKNYVLTRVKNFILSQRIHGGGTPPEFVYGGSYITSKNLGRAHGLIFNWTNATGDNTKAQSRQGSFAYSLKDLSNFAKKNVHIVRNVFLRCN